MNPVCPKAKFDKDIFKFKCSTVLDSDNNVCISDPFHRDNCDIYQKSIVTGENPEEYKPRHMKEENE